MFKILRNFALLSCILCLLSGTLFIVGCTDDDDNNDNNNDDSASDYAFIVATDFTTGSFFTVMLDEPRTITYYDEEICADAISRFWNNYAFVIGRLGCDNIQILDPLSDFSTVMEYSVGSGTNPQDIAVVSDQKAYVSRMLSDSLLIVDTMTGEQISEIDLSAYADEDGFPELYLMYYIEDINSVFIAAQRLYEWVPQEPAYVIVVDTITDTIRGEIQLQGLNPWTDFVYDSSQNKLFLGCVGNWGYMDGGIESINVDTLSSEGFIITEETLNGDLLDFDLYSPTRGYALISDSNYATKVIAFNPQSGSNDGILIESTSYNYANVAVNNRDEVWVLENALETPAIHIFTASDMTVIEKLDTIGPPFWVNFVYN